MTERILGDEQSQLSRRDAIGAGALALGSAAISLTPGCTTYAQSLPSDFHFLSLSEVSELISAREISPTELTRAMLDRINTVDGQLNSYAAVMAEHAMAQATAAEQEIMGGRNRGPLHGVPVAVKDLCFTAGFPTKGGLQVLSDHVPEFDATVVSRLIDAGAVLLGKLNLTEGAMAGYHPNFQVPRNPWDAQRWAGASSSGSGAATAAGLCFASLGSDTLGSIRFPSASCGLVGLKPTYGRVSRYGVLPLAESMDHIGPMARTSADAAVMLEAIAGQDVNDSTALADPVPAMLREIDQGVAGLRIGFDERYASEGVEPGLFAAISESLKLLEGLGARVIPIEMPPADPDAAFVITGAEAVLGHSATYPSRRDDYGPAFRDFLDINAGISGVQYANAHLHRQKFTGALRTAMEPVDVLACPAMPDVAYPARPDQLYGTFEAVTSLFSQNITKFTAPFNLSGSPTISLPCGFSNSGLPYSIQFAGKPLSEALLCRTGHAYEQETQWHKRHPIV